VEGIDRKIKYSDLYYWAIFGGYLFLVTPPGYNSASNFLPEDGQGSCLETSVGI